MLWTTSVKSTCIGSDFDRFYHVCMFTCLHVYMFAGFRGERDVCSTHFRQVLDDLLQCKAAIMRCIIRENSKIAPEQELCRRTSSGDIGSVYCLQHIGDYLPFPSLFSDRLGINTLTRESAKGPTMILVTRPALLLRQRYARCLRTLLGVGLVIWECAAACLPL